MLSPLRFHRLHQLAFLVTGVAVLGLAVGAKGDSETRGLLLNDGSTWHSRLVSLNSKQVQFADASEERFFYVGDWCRWGHPALPARRPRIIMQDGSCLVSREEWSTKVPITLKAGSVELDHVVFGATTVPRGEVQLVLLNAAGENSVVSLIKAEVKANSPQQDRVWLVGGDALSGDVISFDGNLRFRTAGQELSLAAADIAAVYLHTRLPPTTTPLPRCWLGFADGTTIAGTEVEIDQDSVKVITTSGLRLSGTRKDNIVFVQTETLRAYLSDQQPLDYLHTPYFELPRSLVQNSNLDNRLAIVASSRYLKCLAMPTASRAVFRVPTKMTHFTAHVAIDDSSGDQGSAVFRVYRVLEQSPQLAYESPVVRGADLPHAIRVPVEGAEVVILVVDFADYGDQLDHCLWLDPRWVAMEPSQ